MNNQLPGSKVSSILNSPFTLLDDRASRLFLVIFCGLFATFFIYFFNPFNIQEIRYETALAHSLSIWSAGVVGAFLIAFTQFGLRKLFKLNTFTIGRFSIWVVFEFLMLCTANYILFGESRFPFFEEYLSIMRYTISLAVLPYFLACLIIAVVKLSVRVNQNGTEKQHVFKDENGKAMLAVKPSQILYLKSEDNYTSIFYQQNDKVEKMLIRTNLKKLENELDYSELIRIHRSYMVNLDSITSVQRDKGTFLLQLKNIPEMHLRVSDTYKDAFASKIED